MKKTAKTSFIRRASRVVSGLLAAILLLAPTVFAEPSEPVSIYVDGIKLASDTEPIVYENRTLLPLRSVFESLDVPALIRDNRTLIPLRAYAAAQNITLPPEYTDGMLCDVALLQKAGRYEEVLKGYNTTDKAFRDFLADTALLGYVKSLFSDVSERECTDYVRAVFVRAKHILTPSLAAAQKAEEELKNGADFETLIKTYGTDFYEQKVGYIFCEGMRTPAFEKASFALKEGEVSDIVESPFGYHIIKRYSFDGVTDEEIMKICGKEAAKKYSEARLRETLKPYAERLIPDDQ